MLHFKTEPEGNALNVTSLAPPWALGTGDVVQIIRNKALSKEFGAEASGHEHWHSHQWAILSKSVKLCKPQVAHL